MYLNEVSYFYITNSKITILRHYHHFEDFEQFEDQMIAFALQNLKVDVHMCNLKVGSNTPRTLFYHIQSSFLYFSIKGSISFRNNPGTKKCSSICSTPKYFLKNFAIRNSSDWKAMSIFIDCLTKLYCYCSSHKQISYRYTSYD